MTSQSKLNSCTQQAKPKQRRRRQYLGMSAVTVGSCMSLTVMKSSAYTIPQRSHSVNMHSCASGNPSTPNVPLDFGRDTHEDDFARFTEVNSPIGTCTDFSANDSSTTSAGRKKSTTRMFFTSRLSRNSRQQSQLSYRNGSSDETQEQQNQNKQAFKSLDQSSQKRVSEMTAKWWQSVSVKTTQPASTSSDQHSNEQQDVDKYLEFLDKRYHSLNKEGSLLSDPSSTAGPKFSVLKWVLQGHISETTVDNKDNENALYAFGLAGMASDRLRQKHHKSSAGPREERHVSSIVADTEVVGKALSVTGSPQFTASLNAAANAIQRIKAKRSAFIAYKEQVFKNILDKVVAKMTVISRQMRLTFVRKVLTLLTLMIAGIM